MEDSTSTERLDRQIDFLMRIDDLKAVERQSRVLRGQRPENSAEHSWHLAMFALILEEHGSGVDIAKVIAMLLIHDIVEVIAGDTPFHAGDTAIQARDEAGAAEALFGALPDDQHHRFLALWQEFEAGASPEARFAKGLDRLQPLLLNALRGGGTWKLNGLKEDAVVSRYGPPIAAASEILWQAARGQVRRHFATNGSQRPG